MGTYILKRLLFVIPTLFFILLSNFAIVQMAPGGPVEQAIESARHYNMLGSATGKTEVSSSNTVVRYQGNVGLRPEMIEQIKAQYGFDKPAHERFWLMLKSYARFDFGNSFFKDKPVLTLIKEALPVSLSLGLWTTLMVYAIAIPLGIKKAIRHNDRFDAITGTLLALGVAVPTVSLGVLLLVFLAGGSYVQWFPLQGLVSDNFNELSVLGKIKDYFWHLALPLLTAVVAGFAGLTFLTKFSFLEELGKQFVLTARAKGLSSSRVLYGHVFRNAMLVVIAGLPSALVGVFLGSNVLVEKVFGLQGLGLLGLEAIQLRDYPVIFGSLFIFTLLGLVLSIISDVMYMLIDPRINLSKGSEG